jgi:hypothetical protein
MVLDNPPQTGGFQADTYMLGNLIFSILLAEDLQISNSATERSHELMKKMDDVMAKTVLPSPILRDMAQQMIEYAKDAMDIDPDQRPLPSAFYPKLWGRLAYYGTIC